MRKLDGIGAKLPGAVVVAVSVFVAWHAFRLAYAGSKAAAVDMGVLESSAGSYPWCIEGVVIVASTATMTLPKGERALAWVVLCIATGVSCATNVLHALDAAGHEVWSPGFAVAGPLALPACVRLAERVLLATLRRPLIVGTPAQPPAGVPTPTTAPAPTPGAGTDGPPVPETAEAPGGPSVPPAPSGPVHPQPDRTDAGLDVDTGPDWTPDSSGRPVSSVHPSSPPDGPDAGPDSGLDSEPDIHRTVRSPVRRQSGGRRAGQSTGRRAGRTAERSALRPVPSEPDWTVIARVRGVSRSRAYELAKDPHVVAEARAADAVARDEASGEQA